MLSKDAWERDKALDVPLTHPTIRFQNGIVGKGLSCPSCHKYNLYLFILKIAQKWWASGEISHFIKAHDVRLPTLQFGNGDNYGLIFFIFGDFG